MAKYSNQMWRVVTKRTRRRQPQQYVYKNLDYYLFRHYLWKILMFTVKILYFPVYSCSICSKMAVVVRNIKIIQVPVLPTYSMTPVFLLTAGIFTNREAAFDVPRLAQVWCFIFKFHNAQNNIVSYYSYLHQLSCYQAINNKRIRVPFVCQHRLHGASVIPHSCCFPSVLFLFSFA